MSSWPRFAPAKRNTAPSERRTPNVSTAWSPSCSNRRRAAAGFDKSPCLGHSASPSLFIGPGATRVTRSILPHLDCGHLAGALVALLTFGGAALLIHAGAILRSEEHTSEPHSLMRIS